MESSFQHITLLEPSLSVWFFIDEQKTQPFVESFFSFICRIDFSPEMVWFECFLQRHFRLGIFPQNLFHNKDSVQIIFHRKKKLVTAVVEHFWILKIISSGIRLLFFSSKFGLALNSALNKICQWNFSHFYCMVAMKTINLIDWLIDWSVYTRYSQSINI